MMIILHTPWKKCLLLVLAIFRIYADIRENQFYINIHACLYYFLTFSSKIWFYKHGYFSPSEQILH